MLNLMANYREKSQHFGKSIKNHIWKDKSSPSIGPSVVPWKTAPTVHMLLHKPQCCARKSQHEEQDNFSLIQYLLRKKTENPGGNDQETGGLLTYLPASLLRYVWSNSSSSISMGTLVPKWQSGTTRHSGFPLSLPSVAYNAADTGWVTWNKQKKMHKTCILSVFLVSKMV
jgi:hypothetical protein